MTLFPLLPLPATRARISSTTDDMAMMPSKHVEEELSKMSKEC
jgi:hypothetical protein